tara:strand:+ start:2494 stop:3144 length:651 start_codon:yes stop_codon:yes gene_type:complete
MTVFEYRVEKIERKDCEEFILAIHYAKRWPSISFAYGLFRDGTLVGVVTYGSPPSSPLRNGIAGKENAKDVVELNRLCLRDNLKCEASRLVGASLRMLPKPKIVVSFADSAQGHEGIVYRATNFGYYGLSAKRTDWKVKGLEHLHGQTIADEFRGTKNRAKAMREKYGDDFYLAPRSRKHRYIICIGESSWVRDMLGKIRYERTPWKRKITEDDCF